MKIKGLYLGKIPVEGILLNSWKTLNMNTAYRIKLTDTMLLFGSLHDEVILLEEDIIT